MGLNLTREYIMSAMSELHSTLNLDIKLRQYCNNKATRVHVGNLCLCFSYTTLIGYHCNVTGVSKRIPNTWGPTTGKHFSEMNLTHATVTDPDTLATDVQHALFDAAISATMNEPAGGVA